MQNRIALALVIALSACAEPAQQVDEVEQNLSTYRRSLFFSDESMTEMVGERSSLCTSTTNWGVRTPWVYTDSGSCEWNENVGPAQWPQPGGGSCVCCNDGDGNGQCGPGESAGFHFCSSSFGCF